MNLREVSEHQDRSASDAASPDAWRNSHIIRFSQIDGAGIVFYPRYFEMLADSFPQQCALPDATADQVTRIQATFRQPARLGERLVLQARTDTGDFAVRGIAAGDVCFELGISQQPATPAWPADANAFVRQAEIHEWMTGADSRMHLSRCYELTATLMEEWFNAELGYPFATLHATDGASVPTVSLDSDVHRRPVNGETVHLALSVLQVGRSSLQMGMQVSSQGQLLVQTRQVVVFVRNENGGLSSVAIPAALAGKLREQLVPQQV